MGKESKGIMAAAVKRGKAEPVVPGRLPRWMAAMALVMAAVMLATVLPEAGAPVTALGEDYGWEGERGPEYPAIDDEFAADPSDTTPASVTVTLVDSRSGKKFQVATTTGAICLPTAGECGFAASDGALFVGWSTNPAGSTNVYASGQMFPDNGAHNAQLSADTTLYAVWLPQGASESRNIAYFYIRTDGAIPFEPAGHSSAHYVPAGSATTLQGSLRWPIAVTNNLEAVASNIQTAPTDQQIQQAMEKAGGSYDPRTQTVVWYVVKGRASGAANTWNVDGIVMDKAAHLVLYEPNGGDSAVPAAQSHYQGDAVAVNTAVVPQRFGYDFLGWATSPTATVPTYPAGQTGSFTMPAQQVILYAVWRQGTVSVTYVAEPNGYGTVAPQSNSVVALTGEGVGGAQATPARGKVFEGWYQGNRRITSDALLTAETARANLLTQRNVVLPTQFVARFIDPSPALALEKTIANAPANGEYYIPGESVEFALTLTNTGNMPLRQIKIDDSLAILSVVDDLAVGESRTLTYRYEVTEADADEEAVRNIAVASGTIVGQATHKATSNPASVAALVSRPPANSSYVLYSAYPQAGGRVDISYEVVDAATAEGLHTVTATAQEGYVFQGWYRHDGELVSTQEALSPDLIKSAMLDEDEARVPYAPTLLLAYFTPKDDENPNNPDTPDNPDVPTNPDDPGTSDLPDNPGDDGGSDVPDEPGAADGSAAGNATANGSATFKPGGSSGASAAHRSASAMPRTADSTAPVFAGVGAVAAAAAVMALVARRRRAR